MIGGILRVGYWVFKGVYAVRVFRLESKLQRVGLERERARERERERCWVSWWGLVFPGFQVYGQCLLRARSQSRWPLKMIHDFPYCCIREPVHK